MAENLTKIQQRMLQKLKTSPAAWADTTMAEADAFDALVEKGLATTTVVHDGLRPATLFHLAPQRGPSMKP